MKTLVFWIAAVFLLSYLKTRTFASHHMMPDGGDDEEGDGNYVITHGGIVHVHRNNNQNKKDNFEDPNFNNKNNKNDEDNSAVPRSRRKRFIVKDESRRWTGGIVPYVYRSSLTESEIHEIEAAMRRYEKYTCIRFVPWIEDVTRTDHDLDHDSRLIFVNDRSTCSSYIGNKRSANGQTLKCCGRTVCIHELGHALGMPHEHQHPYVTGWVRVNWENIKKDYWKWYRTYRAEDYKMYEYDITSTMHYGTGAFSSNGRLTQTLLFPELSIANSDFYLFHEIADSHGCQAIKCSGIPLTCENDGYPTVIDNECACNCPYGLDRETGCTTTITKGVASQPTMQGGSYALLSPVQGCPGDNVFSEGQITHWSNGGSGNSAENHLKGSFQSESTTLYFCVAENYTSSVSWPTGSYCIHRVGGKCPQGFDEGYIQFDDVIRSEEESNSNSGALPDGVYGDNTLFYYCCRDDGFQSEPLQISDTTKPLVLYQYSSSCPSISGMFGIEETFSFANFNGEGTIAKTSGAHPKVSKSSSLKYTISVCYYTPLTMDCGGVIELDDSKLSTFLTSPNYPGPYDSTTECNWLVKAPEGSTIVLSFEDFEFEDDGSKCKDSVEIRHSRLGQNGIRYCGDSMKGSIRSIFNTMSLTMRTDLSENRRGFNATVTLIRPEDHCFNVADNGKTYRGDVNFARTMEPCLPWWSTTKCDYHAYDGRYFNDGLDRNYCRNPGDGLRPWCYTGYTKADGCVRNYCDVCLRENIYDAVDYCADIVDDAFCRDDPEAYSLCAKSCIGDLPESSSLPKASETLCGFPQIPSGGVLVSSPKASYGVGETIEVKCNTTGVIVTGTCLTDSTWNLGNYVCGVCPTGWAPHNEFCYKYFHDRLIYHDAKLRCAEFGGIIAPTGSREDLDYILSQRQFMSKIWLGADDLVTEGDWVWQDGTDLTWSLWAEGQPSSDDCAYIDREDDDSVWITKSCDSEEYAFVCRAELAPRTDFADRQNDCVEIFTTDPKACTSYPDFASHECAYTCGLGAEKTCTLPPLNDNVELVTNPGETVAAGDYVTYQCASDHLLTDGNLVRGCLPTGQLTGSDSVCTSVQFLVTPNNDVELIYRSSTGSSRDFYTGLSANFQISKKGEIKEWRFFSKYEGDVAFQVWRPSSTNRYEFVGQNLIETQDDTVQYAAIQPAERIQVKVGDLIGVYYGESKGGIPKSSCHNYYGIGLRSTTDYDGTFVPGWIYDFDTVTCHRFSLTAMVGPSEITLNSDVELIPRSEVAELDRIYTGSTPEFLISKQGEIIEWHFYTSAAVTVSLQVWRWISGNSYQLVGQNVLTSETDTSQIAQIEEGRRIQVQEGDVIGIYQQQNGGIPFDICSEGFTLMSNLTYASPSELSEGQIVSFDTTTEQCRRFSVAAKIGHLRTPSLNNNVELKSRKYIGSSKTVYTGLQPELVITQPGEISEWHFYSTGAGNVALQVWRPIDATRLVFLGQNHILTVENELQIVPIPEEERIPVESGDLIGIYYGDPSGGVSYENCNDKEGLVATKINQDPEDFFPGKEFTIDSSLSCRRFSVAAMVLPLVGLPAYPRDRWSDCLDFFTTDPTICLSNTYFASTICAYTCGSESDTTCSIGSVNDNIEVVSSHANEAVTAGGSVTYQCASDHILTEGNLLRGCLPTGQLTGSDPVCTSVNLLVAPNNNAELIYRSGTGSSKDFYTGLSDDFKITKNGEIKEWRFFSKFEGDVAFQVWRPYSQNRYEFVGQNLVRTEDNTIQFAPIDPAERIQVEDGDLIGVYYGKSKGGIPKSSCDDSEGIGLRSTTDYDGTFVPGWIYDFNTVTCHRFSLTAMVGPSEITLNSDVDLIVRSGAAELNRIYTGSMPEFLISKQGEIIEWHFYSSASVSLALQVWRKISANSYELVGQNVVTSEAGSSQIVPIDEWDRIQVEEGDIIGVYQQQNDGISFDACSLDEGFTVMSDLTYSSPSELFEGQIVTFDSTTEECRRFSVSAKIGHQRTASLNNNVDVKSRSYKAGGRTVYTGLMPDFVITQPGEISEWHFYSIAAGDVALQVWRQLNETRFEFRGQNEIVTLANELQIVHIPQGERIKVESGDLIGIYFGSTRGGVCYSYCNNIEGLVVKKSYMDPEDFVVGTELTVGGSPRCRRFSVAAMVEPA